jgi:TRAP-type mannitol/chloroaromatic compound transport system permease large subunit
MKIRKELWFGFTIMALIVLPVVVLTPWTNLTNGSLGLLMLGLVVVAIMLGFPTAFTLMGMGVAFSWFFYRGINPDLAVRQVLDLMVQRAYGVMSNDVLIAVPLFVFMGYLVERAALIEKLFKSLHLSMARVPGSLAVATIVTCAIFATATGIVGAVVTLMGLLAMPAMLRAGYNTKIAAGAITAGGCLGILIPPSVLLIVYGATAGVSVVQLYAGAFFPGIMLASLYVGYVILTAMIKPEWMPPLPEAERHVPLPSFAEKLQVRGRNALIGLGRSMGGAPGVPAATVLKQFFIVLLPALAIIGILAFSYNKATAPVQEASTAGLVQAGGEFAADVKEAVEGSGDASTGLAEPPAEGNPEKTTESTGLTEPPVEGEKPPVAAVPAQAETPQPPVAAATPVVAAEALPVPNWYWILFGIGAGFLLLIYWMMTWQRLEIFKMLLGSFFPLAVLILSVLGSIVMGLATPTEAAAVGAFGGFVLAAAYRYIAHYRGNADSAVGTTVRELGTILKESSFLTAKTSAMVCWLFVGSAIFSAAFALLGGQEIIEKWVLSLGLTPIQFMLLAQFIIFILGWPLEWTEIIVIFMPIFIPLLPKFGIDPLFFGLLVALNLQTAFLSPPVAMAAFYLKGVAPKHVTLNQIFMGMMPFMVIQMIALALLYMFPGIGLWLPQTLYK